MMVWVSMLSFGGVTNRASCIHPYISRLKLGVGWTQLSVKRKLSSKSSLFWICGDGWRLLKYLEPPKKGVYFQWTSVFICFIQRLRYVAAKWLISDRDRWRWFFQKQHHSSTTLPCKQWTRSVQSIKPKAGWCFLDFSAFFVGRWKTTRCIRTYWSRMDLFGPNKTPATWFIQLSMQNCWSWLV